VLWSVSDVGDCDAADVRYQHRFQSRNSCSHKDSRRRRTDGGETPVAADVLRCKRVAIRQWSSGNWLAHDRSSMTSLTSIEGAVVVCGVVDGAGHDGLLRRPAGLSGVSRLRSRLR
jgi:hypothetical protein